MKVMKPYLKHWVKSKDCAYAILMLYNHTDSQSALRHRFGISYSFPCIVMSGSCSISKKTQFEVQCLCSRRLSISGSRINNNLLEQRTTVKVWKGNQSFAEFAWVCSSSIGGQILIPNTQQVLIIDTEICDMDCIGSIKNNKITLGAGHYNFEVSVSHFEIEDECDFSDEEIYELGGNKLDDIGDDCDGDIFCEYNIRSKKVTKRTLTFKELKRVHKVSML